ncbi:hypothetical protein L226DRAFT_277095 [Lentinus tigrinus ALCF2SS1-7]|uniref:Uncharacterized protein n=1 Tax=Lentinus tigrinus ALCF2SS1-6 TaxID=1328759 RepID=A0A5C2RU62_9APHY|nr:hypothetical protein L227DRAFT_348373 [Lentinus tigrinus ALCF2SS1-6]RPD69377.1 hypothetical protein L226DRAFT_277095 [Lentinus tigrinus ALCF2SS1-7]
MPTSGLVGGNREATQQSRGEENATKSRSRQQERRPEPQCSRGTDLRWELPYERHMHTHGVHLRGCNVVYASYTCELCHLCVLVSGYSGYYAISAVGLGICIVESPLTTIIAVMRTRDPQVHVPEVTWGWPVCETPRPVRRQRFRGRRSTDLRKSRRRRRLALVPERNTAGSATDLVIRHNRVDTIDKNDGNLLKLSSSPASKPTLSLLAP